MGVAPAVNELQSASRLTANLRLRTCTVSSACLSLSLVSGEILCALPPVDDGVDAADDANDVIDEDDGSGSGGG